jgi:hypothetical protein
MIATITLYLRANVLPHISEKTVGTAEILIIIQRPEQCIQTRPTVKKRDEKDTCAEVSVSVSVWWS